MARKRSTRQIHEAGVKATVKDLLKHGGKIEVNLHKNPGLQTFVEGHPKLTAMK